MTGKQVNTADKRSYLRPRFSGCRMQFPGPLASSWSAVSLGKCRCLSIPQQWVLTARCYILHFDFKLVIIGLRCLRCRVARTWTLNALGSKWSYATSKSIKSNDSAKTHPMWRKNLAWSHVPNFCNLAVWSLEEERIVLNMCIAKAVSLGV